MIQPQAICIEDLTASAEAARYLRCVALVGRQPGLRLDETGKVAWQSAAPVAGELWVSQDERLILYRPEGAPPLTLHRAGRSLAVPYGKPVVVIDQDQVEVNTRQLRIHLHGEARVVAAPTPVPVPVQAHPLKKLGQAAAAAAIVGAALAAGGCVTPVIPTIEVREQPPAPTAPTVPTVLPTPTIEVREQPPTATQAQGPSVGTPMPSVGTPTATSTLTPTVTSPGTLTPLPTNTPSPIINILGKPAAAATPPMPLVIHEAQTIQKMTQSKWPDWINRRWLRLRALIKNKKA